MTGSVQTKNNKYYAVLNIYDENHKRKQKWIDLELSSKGGNYRKAKKSQPQNRGWLFLRKVV